MACLFKPTDLAPCVIDDGPAAYSAPAAGEPGDERGESICMGCERDVEGINYELAVPRRPPIYPAAKSRSIN